MSGRVALAIGLLVGLTGCPGTAPSPPVAEQDGIAVRDAYATVSAAPETSAFYCTISNADGHADTLLGIESSAGMAMLHTVVTVDGRSSMQSVPRLEIPGRGEIRMRPGGYHVMLADLPVPLQSGDTVEIGLSLVRAGTLRFRAPVVTYTDLVQHLEQADRASR
jgi:copper(I)-binding protein